MIKLHFEFLDWVGVFGGVLVLLPHFYGLIALSTEQSGSAAIEGKRKYAIFCCDGTRLWLTEN
jgi:hypothetical protein